ncbi:MAG: TRAP transporter permease [Betaproteobacteria bacterium]|nr:TRAP transporter permease [Betaproteobacteria bacterium]
MAEPQPALSEEDRAKILENVVAVESGGRRPSGLTKSLFLNVAVVWSLFQLWIASPIPYSLGWGVINSTGQRAIHLAVAIFLVFIIYPRGRRSPRAYVPAYDWVFAVIAAACSAYLFVFSAELVTRPGSPTTLDLVVTVAGIVLLLEATRRALGWPMTIMAIIFIIYMFAGPYMPDMIAHKGTSLGRAASQMWLTSEGVFGVALGVSAEFVFLYVLFGAMLDQAGAGNWMTRVAFSLMGHLRGGPAKASVLSSGLNGIISGSSVANVLTGGNVTIMLMKRVGYSPVKAGAIEVSSSINGQLMPPVMGAAAFLMVEYVNLPYTEIIKHAFLPAVFSYISLLWIVHLEAVSLGMKGLKRPHSPFTSKLVNWTFAIAGLVITVQLSHWLSAWIPGVFGELGGSLFVGALVFAAYVAGVAASARYPDASGDITENLDELPLAKPTVLAGLFYILPIYVLVWCLMVLEQSPGLAAFYACAVMIVMLTTQRPLIAFFRKLPTKGELKRGFDDLYVSLHAGARNMLGVAIATATAGIVVGSVSVTGIGQVLAEVVEVLSLGNLLLALLLTAGLSLILGMGLPTTANYIVVSTLLAPVIVKLAASHGVEVPLVAVHLFVFYFGIMADTTPPVALAAFAAAGLSGADPLKTGIQAFVYNLRTAILPFVFVFNTELLLMNIGSPAHLAWVVVTGLIACLVFASATQGWFVVSNRWWEGALLLLATFILLRPGYLRDQFHPPFEVQPPAKAVEAIKGLKPGENIRLRVEVDDKKGRIQERTFLLPRGKGDAKEALATAGVMLEEKDGKTMIADVVFDSPAEKVGLDIADNNRVVGVETRLEQPGKEMFTVPAWLLIALVFGLQWRRRKSEVLPDAPAMR